MWAFAPGAFRRLRHPWTARWLPLAVLVASTTLALGASGLVFASMRDDERARFENAMQVARDRIEARLSAQFALLQGARGLFSASERVERREFRAYVDGLDLERAHRGVRGIGWTPWVSRSAVASLEAQARADGVADFRVWPERPGEPVCPLVFLEPADARNHMALGYDLASEATRLATLERARDTGAAQMTPRIRLVQETDADAQPGFVVYLPVYRSGRTPASLEERREGLLGFVSSPYRTHDLFSQIFGSETSPRVAFRIYDGERVDDAELLFDTMPRDHLDASLHAQETLTMAGRPWTIVFASLPSLDVGHAKLVTAATLAVGFVASLMLWLVTRMLVRALGQAERAFAAQSQMVSVVTHDLRSPLHAMALRAELLGRSASDPERTRETAAAIGNVAARMDRLIRDLLDASVLEAGGFPVAARDVRVRELVEPTVELLRPLSAARAIDVRAVLDPAAELVHGDSERLQQVLANLIGNALKFAPAGSEVEVVCARDAGAVRFEVKDRGPGVPAEHMASVFERHFQVDGRLGGAGLGLFIARGIVVAHGGRIWIERRDGVTTFAFTVPDGARQGAASRSSAS